MAIQVQLLISINGGAYNPGTQENVAPASTVALKTSVNGGLLNAIRYEIYEYPPGFACPAGWVVDPTTVSAVSTGVYIFQPSNVTTAPPSFSIPGSGAQNWGWFMCRVRGNNNPAQLNDDGSPNTAFSPSLVDETGCLNVLSPVLRAKGVARGLTTQDDGLRAWVGPLMQSLRAMDNAASGASFSAGGDLAGSGISQTVVALRGNPLSAVAPTAGQFLVEQAGAIGSAWTSISGDATASATTPGKLTVTGIQGSAVPAPSTGFLQWTGSAYAWGTPGGGFTAGGDLGGTSTNQNVLAVHGASVPSAGGLVTGNVLQVVGSSALNYGAVNLAGGAGYVTGILPAGNQAAQTMGGDVTGTTAASVVAKVNGATVPIGGSLTPGNVLQVLSGGALTYGTVNLSNPNSVSGSVSVAQGGTGLSAIGTADQLLGVNHAGTALAYFTPGGDATLASGNFTVVGLQGFSVATTTPTSGQVLTWNAGTSKWTATTPGSGASVTGSGDWHSTAGALDAAASKGTAGQFRTTNAGATDTAWTTLSGDVSASVSTVGQITVTALQTHAVSSSAPTAGQFLVENAAASSWVPTSLSQDVSASLVTPGALTVVGIRTVSVPALAAGYLQYTGSAFAWTTPANSSVTGSGVWHSTAGVLDSAASKGTAGQFLLTNAGATDTAWTTLSADVTASTGTPGAITVVAIRGNPVTVTAPTAGQVLIENAGATASAWTSFSGDVTLSTSTPGLATVVGLKGQTIPTLASGWLQWTGSAFAWSTPPGAFTAGGDLSGTSTSQTVIGIQGRAVASTAPTNGQVLEWNNGASQWQPTNLPAGTSVTGSGFWHSTAGTLDGAASKGTAGQFAVTNAGATDATWASISGDATNSTSTPGKLTVTGLQGNPVSATAATAGQVLVENSGATGSAWTSFSGDVTLSTGTPGAATVVAIQGHGIVSTAPTAGQFLVENAAATNWVPTSLSGDVSASTGTPGQITVTGIRSNAVPSLASGFLQWTGSAFAWSTPGSGFTAGGDLSGTATSQTVIGIQGNPVNATAATAGQLLIENSGATGSKWTSFSGDVTLSTSVPGAATVVALHGNPIAATTPTAGQFLVENAGATSWGPVSISGDVSASVSTVGKLTVTGIQGAAVPALAAGYLQYTGSAFAWTSGGVQTLIFQPGGTAGGNVYTTWASLYAAAGAVQSDLSIFFDLTRTGNATTIPAGAYAFTQAYVEWTGDPNNFPTITCASGVTISGVQKYAKMFLVNGGSAPVTTFSTNGASLVVYLDQALVYGSSTAPFFSNAGSLISCQLNLVVYNGQVGDGTHAALSAIGAGSVQISTYQGSVVASGSITGTNSSVVPFDAASSIQASSVTVVNASQAGVTQLVFQPSGTPVANVFTSWAVLYSYAQSIPGALKIVFDGSHNSNACMIPSGTWAFTNPSVKFDGLIPITGGAITTVTCANGAQLSGVSEIANITLDTVSTSPVFSISGSSVVAMYVHQFALLKNSGGSAPLIQTSGTAQFDLVMEKASIGDASGHVVIATSGATSTATVQLFDSANALAGTITGTGASVIVAGAAANNLSGLTPTLQTKALNIGYSDSLTPHLGVTNVQAAIDALKGIIGSGAISQLTGDVLAGPGTGSQVATVVAISGTSPIAITPNNLQWVQGATAPTLTQAQQANAAAPKNFTIAPQAPGASATNATNGTPGSLVANVAAPVNGGTEAGLQLQRAGTLVFEAAQFNGTGSGGIWLGNVTPGLSNYAIASDTLNTSFNAPVQLEFSIAGLPNVLVTTNGMQLFGAVSFGGGTGVLSIANATTVPTAAAAGNALVYSDSGSLEIFASGLQFHRLGTPALLQVGATTDVTPQNLVITPQAPFSGATTTAHKTPGSVVVNLPVPVSGGSEATFAVQRNGTLAASIDADGVVLLVNTSASQSGHSNAATIWSELGGSLTLLPSSSGGFLATDGGQTASVALTTNLAKIGGNSSCNILLGTSAPVDGGSGVVGLQNVATAPTSLAATNGIEFYSRSVTGLGTNCYFEVNANGYLLNPTIVAGGIGQLAGAGAGTRFTVFAQGGGPNSNGGDLILHSGDGSGSGQMGRGTLQSPDGGVSSAVSVTSAAASVQAGHTFGLPLCQMVASNSASLGVTAYQLDAALATYCSHSLSYVTDGSVNSQTAQHYRKAKFGQLTSSGVAMSTSFTVNNNTQVLVKATLQGRVVTPGSGTSLGDLFNAVYYVTYQAIGGAVTRLGSIIAAYFEFPASLTSASGYADSVSGLSVTVDFNMTTASGALGTADATIWLEVYYN